MKKKIRAVITYLPNYNREEWGPVKYGTPDSSGFDLCAAIDHEITIHCGESVKIPTGIKIYSPDAGWFIDPRSGLAVKHGINTTITHGVIDSDYLGEICVSLFNTGSVCPNGPRVAVHGMQYGEDFIVKPGMRIAQGIIDGFSQFEFEEISNEEFNKINTDRGSGGFGSTGV